MGKLFPGVPRIKNAPNRIAVMNPSLWLGFLPVVGGAITTPMQLGEIDRANDWQSAAHHFAKLLAIRSARVAGGNATEQFPGGRKPAASMPRESRTVAEALRRRQVDQATVMRAAVRRFSMRVRPPLPTPRFNGDFRLAPRVLAKRF